MHVYVKTKLLHLAEYTCTKSPYDQRVMVELPQKLLLPMSTFTIGNNGTFSHICYTMVLIQSCIALDSSSGIWYTTLHCQGYCRQVFTELFARSTLFAVQCIIAKGYLKVSILPTFEDTIDGLLFAMYTHTDVNATKMYWNVY